MLSEDIELIIDASTAAKGITYVLARRGLRAAEIQVDRIWAHLPIERDDPQAAAAFQDILIDVHFYFIGLANVYKYLRKLVSDEMPTDLGPELVGAFTRIRPELDTADTVEVFTELRPKLDTVDLFKELRPDLDTLNEQWCRHYSAGRDVFEHIDQRLPGQKHEDQIVAIEEQVREKKTNFRIIRSKGLFLHSNQEWDISRVQFELMQADVEGFLSRFVGIAQANIKG